MQCSICNKPINENRTGWKACSSKCDRELLNAKLIPAWITWIEEGQDYSKIPGLTKELKERNSTMIGMVRGGSSLSEAAKYGGIHRERLRQIIAKFLEIMIDFS